MNEYLEQVGANSVFHPLVEYLHCMLISNTVLLVHFQKWGLGENVSVMLFGRDSGSTRRTGKESEGRMEGGRDIRIYQTHRQPSDIWEKRGRTRYIPELTSKAPRLSRI